LLEAKSNKLIDKVEPYISQLSEAGMWVSGEVRQRILVLANEA
jgi:predicted nucleic acid-binding protein